jgi:putative DNA primase/helicase
MTSAEIAHALGAASRSGAWWRCICPVHGSRTGRSATLALRDGDCGIVVHCHAGCDPRDILGELRRRELLGSAGGYLASRGQSRGDDLRSRLRRFNIAGRIWAAAREARGSPVAWYLAARGITLPMPASLRWAPSLRRQDGSYGPAMVARVDDAGGRLVAVHRTWLDRGPEGTWRRLDRASLGPTGRGGVRLAPVAETLLIGEGIETCLAAMQATAQPAWAALSTSGLVALALPPMVRAVIILADHDANGAGERAARTAAHRLAEGRRVRIAMPPEPGSDMADVLAGCSHARVTETADAAA